MELTKLIFPLFFINVIKVLGGPARLYIFPNPVHHKIINDPNQVLPDKISKDNLFGWLNMKNYVKFRLWTRKNPHLAQEIKYNNIKTLGSSNFDPEKLTKLIIHGFADTASEVAITDWMLNMRDGFLKLGDVNVILVDYTIYAVFLLYVSTLPELVGERVGEFIGFLNKSNGAPLESFHLIGWSWGAHVAGFAGAHLNGELGRITGCDPAGPLFKFVSNDHRLDKSDAKFVDIIHVNGGTRLLWGGHYGLIDPLGHVDVYPNGGERQTGCPVENPRYYTTLYCNHGRAVQYFTESITAPLAFPMCKCESLEKYVKGECLCKGEDVEFMGEHLSHKARGIFQIITKATLPYGLGPHIEIQLPNKTPQDKQINFKELRNFIEIGTNIVEDGKDIGNLSSATLIYNGKSEEINNINNTYDSKHYPNEDIVTLVIKALERKRPS